jgi:hypothetical protein
MMHTTKQTRSRAVLFGALFAGLSLTAAPAAAVGTPVYLDAGAGHLMLTTGEAIYRDAQNDHGGADLLRIAYGRKVRLKTPYDGIPGSRTWVIPIPLDVTATNWNVVARGTNGSGTVGQNGHKICSFDSDGNFSNCGAQVLLNPPNTSTVYVPVGGTAFSVTTLNNVLVNPGIVGTSLILDSIRVFNQ